MELTKQPLTAGALCAMTATGSSLMTHQITAPETEEEESSSSAVPPPSKALR